MALDSEDQFALPCPNPLFNTVGSKLTFGAGSASKVPGPRVLGLDFSVIKTDKSCVLGHSSSGTERASLEAEILVDFVVIKFCKFKQSDHSQGLAKALAARGSIPGREAERDGPNSVMEGGTGVVRRSVLLYLRIVRRSGDARAQ